MDSWKVEFYKDIRGKSPVKEFIRSLPPKDYAKALWIVELLKKSGIDISEPYAKHIQGKVWELRFQNIRILYCLEIDTFILLHILKKKTKRTPSSDIQLSLQRMAEYLPRRDKSL